MWFIWRLFYALIGSRLMLLVAGAALDVLERVRGAGAVEGVLGGIERRWVFSGWPHQRRGWVNLHVSRTVAKLRRRHARVVPQASGPRKRRLPLRIGCVGPFSGALGFPRELFAQHPLDVEVFVFDFTYRGHAAEYLGPVVNGYWQLGEAGALSGPQLDRAAALIDSVDLDLLVNVSPKRDAYEIVDRVTTPCIAHWCAGSDLLHHDKLDFQFFAQSQADYFVRDGRMFCATTRAPLDGYRVFDARGYFDPRGLRPDSSIGWRRREPLIVWFGSLYKLAAPDFLGCVLGLLQDDSTLQFAFMGKDDGGALATISSAARQHDVASRVHYEGVFSAIRDDSGEVTDPGWQRLVQHVRRARLSPDPWPMGGGSTRFEAYLLGVPSVHMGVRFDPAAWTRQQLVVCEVPVLLVPAATAFSVAEYADVCRRCLYDETFADAVMRAQMEVAERAGDPRRWWAQVIAAYERYGTPQ